jgi:hypothetical protein
MKKYINIKYWILGWMFVFGGFVNVTFAQTVDLTSHQPSTSPPSGAIFEWHNALPISVSNLVASPTAVIPGLYYGVYNFGTCYSEVAPIRVATNICPVASVDLNSFVDTTVTPSGMALTFHNASPVSDANNLSGSAITAAASGTYYVAYRDNIVGCYSAESVIVVLNSSCLVVILAVTDSPSVLPGTNTPSVIGNDTVNGVPAVIGAALGQVTLISTPVSGSPLTMNTSTGTIAVAASTPAGIYPITYTICAVSNPINCSTVTSNVTVTAPAILPNFSLTIDIDALVFAVAGDTKDFVVNISEINGGPSGGQVIVKIIKPSAFLITYGANTITSAVNGGISVNNTDWLITENGLFITMTLKTTSVIGANLFSAVGFTIARQPNVPAQTSQPITVTIVNSTGSDIYNFDNTYNTLVTAQ